MQVTTLAAQLGLGSEPVDWYRVAISVPFGHLLIDLSPRRDDRLRFCANTGSNPSKFHNPDRLKQPENWSMNTQNVSTLQVFQSISHKCKKVFLQCCPKEFIRFLCECIINLLKGNLQSMKRHHVAKFESEVRLLSLKRTTWKQTRDFLASEKRLQLIKATTPLAINNLSWFGTVCPRSYLRLQRKFHYPVCCKAGTSKVSTFTQSHVPNYFP